MTLYTSSHTIFGNIIDYRPCLKISLITHLQPTKLMVKMTILFIYYTSIRPCQSELQYKH